MTAYETVTLGLDRFRIPAECAPAVRHWIAACTRVGLALDGGPVGASRWYTREMAAAHEAGHLMIHAAFGRPPARAVYITARPNRAWPEGGPAWGGRVSRPGCEVELPPGCPIGAVMAHGLERISGVVAEAILAGAVPGSSSPDEQLGCMLSLMGRFEGLEDLALAYLALWVTAAALILDRRPAFDAIRARLERQRRLERPALAKLWPAPEPRLAGFERLDRRAALGRMAEIAGLGTPRYAGIARALGFSGGASS